MKNRPPKFARHILRYFCAIEFLEEIEGDLHEQFQNRLAKGLWYARLHYLKDVFQAIRFYPEGRAPLFPRATGSFKDSFFHFLKIGYRNLQRSRTTSLITISGLAVSLASFMLIALYLIDESTYDSLHPNADNIYRISHSYKRYGDGVVETDARVPGLWAVALRESVPEVTGMTRFSRFGYPGSVRYEKKNKVFVEQQFFWVDSTYSEMFDLTLETAGDPKSILADAHAVIISEKAAKKYFGTEVAAGETIIYHRDGMDFTFTVAAVMKDYPANAHFHPDFIAGNHALEPLWQRDNEHRVNSWRDAFTYSYIKLEDGTDPAVITAGLKKIFKDHLGDAAELIQPVVVALKDIHFNDGMLIELEPPGERSNLYIFGTIGLLILAIACINYMNLATARSMKRSKEVGLRKTLGVSRSSLVTQFLGESILTTAIAMCLAIVLLLALLPFFNELSGKDFTAHAILGGDVFILITAVTFVVGVVAGSYPAVFLSAFRPMDALKRYGDSGTRGERFRKILVVTQFTITLVLISGALVIDGQLTFIHESKLGKFKDQIIAMRVFDPGDTKKVETLATALGQNAAVAVVAYGTQLPRQENFGWIDTRLKAPALSETEFIWALIEADSNFPKIFNFELAAGRNLSGQDSTSVLINEQALKDLRIDPQTAIGLTLENPFSKEQFRVIGIVKDFPFSSVRKTIAPLIITPKPKNAETIYARIEGQDYAAVITTLERSWKTVYPDSPFEYWFLDDEFNRMYRVERQASAIVRYFALLALCIGCMGLFGLVTFTAEQKRKEIGIRKVLGATAEQILLLLTSRFMKLMLMAFVFGIPLTYLAATQWLNAFAYKIPLTPVYFVAPAAGIIILAFLTVGIESWRAASARPADTIRHE
ncbi:MAG TPA: ABC transporter permease [Chryseosolibacter sp.]|nr:ABC transporter permease [Chryseosolibacter sp.]